MPLTRVTALVDGNASLTSVDKMRYLLSYLSGDASRVVANMPIQGDNYARASENLLLSIRVTGIYWSVVVPRQRRRPFIITSRSFSTLSRL